MEVIEEDMLLLGETVAALCRAEAVLAVVRVTGWTKTVELLVVVISKEVTTASMADVLSGKIVLETVVLLTRLRVEKTLVPDDAVDGVENSEALDVVEDDKACTDEVLVGTVSPSGFESVEPGPVVEAELELKDANDDMEGITEGNTEVRLPKRSPPALPLLVVDEPDDSDSELALGVENTNVDVKLLSTLLGKPSPFAIVVPRRLGLEEPDSVDARGETDFKLLRTVIDKLWLLVGVTPGNALVTTSPSDAEASVVEVRLLSRLVFGL